MCRCRKQWIKCPLHVHEAVSKGKRVKIKTPQTEKEKMRASKGIDAPMLKRRGSKVEAQHPRIRCMNMFVKQLKAVVKKGSVFDLRFPHILRRQNF